MFGSDRLTHNQQSRLNPYFDGHYNCHQCLASTPEQLYVALNFISINSEWSYIMTPKIRKPWHSEFNLSALLDRAGQLRNVPCVCDLTQKPQRGSLNWAIFLSFGDGVEWVFRSPMAEDGDFSSQVATEVLESEVATMKYINENSSIPIPEIFDYRLV